MWVLIDGCMYGYRTWHSLPKEIRIVENDSKQISDKHKNLFVYLFCQQLVTLKQELLARRNRSTKFIKFLICWDGKMSSKFRKQEWQPYKEQRRNLPSRMLIYNSPFVYMDYLRNKLTQVNERYGLVFENAEADDLIAIIARKYIKQDQQMQVVIVSRDIDMYQIVDERIRVYNPYTKEMIDGQGVYDKLGVSPDKVVEFKTLVGDSSDNYIGVRKVGPKTALKIMEDPEQVKKMEEDNPQMEVFKRIATLPYHRLDKDKILRALKDVNYDQISDWQKLVNSLGFKADAIERIRMIV